MDRDSRWIGVFDGWDWEFGEVGLEREGEEVKREEGKGKREKGEDGFGVGRDCRWIGGLDGWDWWFWEFGRFMVMI